MTTPVGFVMVGGEGRMGREIRGIAATSPALEERGAVDAATIDSLPEVLGSADVVVDFSSPAGFAAALQAALMAQKPLVSGTTGLGDAHFQALDRAAESIPVLWAANFSVGVNVLEHLTRLASRALGGFDIEIFEAHHRHKVDAPSGTALFLARAAAEGRHHELEDVAAWTRHGHTGSRTDEEIGFQVVRGGSIVGEHTVFFCGPGERVELTHRAQDRAIFARGALHAARWIVGRRPGRYRMADVLFEK